MLLLLQRLVLGRLLHNEAAGLRHRHLRLRRLRLLRRKFLASHAGALRHPLQRLSSHVGVLACRGSIICAACSKMREFTNNSWASGRRRGRRLAVGDGQLGKVVVEDAGRCTSAEIEHVGVELGDGWAMSTRVVRCCPIRSRIRLDCLLIFTRHWLTLTNCCSMLSSIGGCSANMRGSTCPVLTESGECRMVTQERAGAFETLQIAQVI